MHRTRRRTLLATGLAYRGPARRDDPGGPTGSASTEGGSGTAEDSSQGNEDGQGRDDSGTKTPEIKGEFDPERHARALASAREAEKKAKERAKAADERVAAILKAAGLAPDGKEDPAEQLKAARESAAKATTRARQTAVELAVYKSASKAGADPDAVLDSRGFLAAVADLDPEEGDFSKKVTAAITAAVKNNPKLAAATGQGSGRQGADHTGGSGGPRRSTSLDAAVKRALGG